ncbi:MAG: hypothetical protein H6624_18755 [Bdellovibrionaceae bacterium]|nr:hypothetical protein [Bdellovibrionales bacterium]MCB9086387.1 hypothetical protein [Pseudobdellovibrionaceae bacterium]
MFLGLVLFTVTAVGEDEIAGRGSKFPGFKSGQYGWGGVVGQPFAARYQRWIDWKRAWFADVGFTIDEFLVTHANYAIYLISEDDRWKMDRRVGTALFNVFGGVMASAYLGDKEEEDSQLGLRIGGAFEYLIPKSSWSVRLEVAPVLFLSGRTAGGLEGGIAAVYYFDPKTGKGAVKDYSGESGIDDNTQKFLSGEADFEDTELSKEKPKPKAKKKRKVKKRKKKPRSKKKTKPKSEDDSYRIEKFEENEEVMVEEVEL